MTKPLLAAVMTASLLTVGGCGADGEPVPPTREAATLLAPLPVSVTPLDR